MNKKEQSELMHADCVSIQFIGADGKWELPYALPELLTEPAKERMRHTSFRFVLYGQLESRKFIPQSDSPEQEASTTAESTRTPLA